MAAYLIYFTFFVLYNLFVIFYLFFIFLLFSSAQLLKFSIFFFGFYSSMRHIISFDLLSEKLRFYYFRIRFMPSTFHKHQANIHIHIFRHSYIHILIHPNSNRFHLCAFFHFPFHFAIRLYRATHQPCSSPSLSHSSLYVLMPRRHTIPSYIIHIHYARPIIVLSATSNICCVCKNKNRFIVTCRENHEYIYYIYAREFPNNIGSFLLPGVAHQR